MDAFKTVHRIVRENLDDPHSFSPYLAQTVILFNHAHLYYRGIKIQNFMNKKGNLNVKRHPAVYGAALHLIGNYTAIGSYAVNLALVLKCALDLIKEYTQLSEDYQTLKKTIFCQYPIYNPIKKTPPQKNAYTFLTPSIKMYVHVQIKGSISQIAKICLCIWSVMKQVFKLSMCLCDASLLLNGDSKARYEACTELIADWDNYQAQLKLNQIKLLIEIEKSQALASVILNRLGTNNSIGLIIDELKKAAKIVTDHSQGLAKDLLDVAEDTLDTVYIQAKIAPLHIDLAEGNAAIPALAKTRFPPWAGQEVPVSLETR